MRLRIQIGEEVIEPPDLADSGSMPESCSGGYSMVKSPLPMLLLHVHDGVAGHAAEAGLRFGRIDLFFDGGVEAAVEEDGVIVTAGAPLACLACRTSSCMCSMDLR